MISKPKKKTLIIENESRLPIVVEQFLQLHPEFIVHVEFNSLHKTAEDMRYRLYNAEVLMVKSEWLHKKQLENWVQALRFIKGTSSFILNEIYLWSAASDFNLWTVPDVAGMYFYRSYFNDFDTFLDNLRIVVQRYEVYSIDLANQIHRVSYDTDKKLYIETLI